MINFRFVKTQFKNIIIPLVIFAVILLVLIVPILTQDYLAPGTLYRDHGNGGASGSGIIGAMFLHPYIYFGIPGVIVLFAFSLILSHILISKEIDQRYFASWLTTPMSRRVILNSKLFVLIVSILILYLSFFVLQIIIFPLRFKDFSISMLGRIALYNFGLILLALFWASINWFFISFFNKGSISLSVASAVSIFFILCTGLSLFSANPQLEYLKFFRYFSIASLLNSPFQFGEVPEVPVFPPGKTTVVVSAKLFALKPLDYAWQFPLMFILPIGLFYWGNYYVIKKDLHL